MKYIELFVLMFVCFFFSKGLSFGYVGNLVIGIGKIIDRSIKIVLRKEFKVKIKKKFLINGIFDEYCYLVIFL